MDRREFLRAAGITAGGVAVGGGLLAACDDSEPSRDHMLDHPAKESPIDTVVIVMMENRSFDHVYGWLATDEHYLEAGRSRHGGKFRVDGRIDVSYPAATAGDPPVTTHALVGDADEQNPWRGCGHRGPAHDWDSGRLELNEGFLAAGTKNDEFALGYYTAEDLPMHAALARQFTVLDHHHASLMAGTFPNRQYLHSAQSNGRKIDPGPLDVGIFTGKTIWDLLAKAHVPRRYYYTDIPVLLLWGDQYEDIVASTDRYFDDCEHGKLPRVSVLDPGFTGPLRTDDHPLGDVRIGQRFVREVFGAFQRSSHWEHGVFILVYDEWGGFFDHVPPPLLADERSSPVLVDSFGQSGFRVPAVVASPYSTRGGVDHRTYDHTSILRFLEWRFLGAPAEGPNGGSGRWWLTQRDRHANNLGASLRSSDPEPEWEFDKKVGGYSLPCTSTVEPNEPVTTEETQDPFVLAQPFADKIPNRYPAPSLTPWITGEELTLPNAPPTTTVPPPTTAPATTPATTAPSTTPS